MDKVDQVDKVDKVDKLDVIREFIREKDKNEESRHRLKAKKWINHTNISAVRKTQNGKGGSHAGRGKKPSNFTKRIVGKSAKQVLSDEWKRINAFSAGANSSASSSTEEKGDVTHTESESTARQEKTRNEITYFNVEAPPSVLPTKKYCDITGLVGRYRAPSNNLRYHNAEIYLNVIKPMPPGTDQQYLKLRKADVVLK